MQPSLKGLILFETPTFLVPTSCIRHDAGFLLSKSLKSQNSTVKSPWRSQELGSTAPGISRGHQGAIHRLYPIVFLGDTLTESRMIVPRDHPAGAPVAGQYHHTHNQEGACGLCQPLIASGIFRVAKSSPPMLLKVTYTSQSTQTSSQWGCSNASLSSSSAEPSTGLEAHEITIDLTAAQRLSLVTWPLFAKDLCIVSFTYSIF